MDAPGTNPLQSWPAPGKMGKAALVSPLDPVCVIWEGETFCTGTLGTFGDFIEDRHPAGFVWALGLLCAAGSWDESAEPSLLHGGLVSPNARLFHSSPCSQQADI